MEFKSKHFSIGLNMAQFLYICLELLQGINAVKPLNFSHKIKEILYSHLNPLESRVVTPITFNASIG